MSARPSGRRIARNARMDVSLSAHLETIDARLNLHEQLDRLIAVSEP